MRIRIALTCIVLLLCASIASATNPINFTARVTYTGGGIFTQFLACYGVRFVVNDTTYTLVHGGSSAAEVASTLPPFTEGSTLNYTFMMFDTSNCHIGVPELELGRGALIFRDGATGSIHAPVKLAEKMSVSYKVQLQRWPRQWLITFNINSEYGLD